MTESLHRFAVDVFDWTAAFIIIGGCLVLWLLVVAWAVAGIAELRDWLRRNRPPKHRHEWVYVGTPGGGWSLYKCDCGANEIGA